MRKYPLLLFIFACIYAYSQPQDEVHDGLLISERKQLTVVAEPTTLYKGFFRTGCDLIISSMDKSFSKNSQVLYMDNSFIRSWQMNLQLDYGISNRFQISAVIPYERTTISVSNQADIPQLGDYFTIASVRKGKGIGDMKIGTAYQILKPEYNRQFLTLYFQLTFPTGKSDVTVENTNPVGNGYFEATFDLNYDRIIYPFRLAINPGYIYSFPCSKVLDPGEPEQEVDKGNLLFINIHFYIILNDWISFLNGIGYGYSWPDKMDGAIIEYPEVEELDNSGLYSLSYLPAISFQIKHLRLNQTLYIPISGKNVSANMAYLLSISYVF